MRYYQHPQIPEIATPSTPPSGTLSLYAKTDGALYSKNDAGTEIGPYTGQTYVDSGAPLNAKNYLKGDGTLEVDANVTALMAAWLSTRKTLYWPSGTYLVNPGLLYAPFDGCTMYGDGMADTGGAAGAAFPGATCITQNLGTSGVLFNASGTNTTTRRRYVTIRDLMFDGNDTTGSIIQAYYTTTLMMFRVLNYGKNGYGLDAVELWDSTFVKVDWEWCFSDTQYVVSLRNASAASGFGSSSDNTNATRFYGCRIETFKAGALWIDAGVGTANLHDIAFFGLKVETGISRGTFIHIGNTCSGITMNQIYCYIGGWDAGYSTPITMIQFLASGQSTLRDVYLASGVDNNYVYRGVEIWSNDATIDNVQGLYQHPSSPSLAHIDISSGTSGTFRLNARAIVTNQGVQFNGSPGSWAQDPTDRTNIQVFTAGGTWTKPSNAKNVYVACVGGGGGGGSGRRDATSTVRGGGGGGGSAARSIMEIPADALGATETVTVGTGGAGGTGITANTTNGNVGTAGGSSTFGVHVRALGGGAGGGGTTTGGTAGTAGGGSSQGAAGGAGGTGAAGTAGGDGQMGAGAGGGGGGLSSGNVAFTGGAGGACLSSVTTGGTAGAINGTGGTGTASAASSGIPGAGGGGGGSSVAGAGGAGGPGSRYGGGGGGGGASVNGQTSGAGGAGSGGIVVVICSTGS